MGAEEIPIMDGGFGGGGGHGGGGGAAGATGGHGGGTGEGNIEVAIDCRSMPESN